LNNNGVRKGMMHNALSISFCFNLRVAGVKFSRIPDPAAPSWNPATLFGDPTPKLGDQLEFCREVSPLVIDRHDSFKCV